MAMTGERRAGACAAAAAGGGRATLGRGSLLDVGHRTLAELPDANTTIWRARDIFRVNVEATEEHAFQTMREATLGRPRTAF